jgi:hypothetical protein
MGRKKGKKKDTENTAIATNGDSGEEDGGETLQTTIESKQEVGNEEDDGEHSKTESKGKMQQRHKKEMKV